MPPKKTKKKKEKGSSAESELNNEKGGLKRRNTSRGRLSDLGDFNEEEFEEEVLKRKSRGKLSLGRISGDQLPEGRLSRVRISGGTAGEMAEVEEDIVTLIVPETAQKIVHCLVGKDLFVDKTWCMVKKADIMEDVAIEDANSPFHSLTQRIKQYKPSELLIGYEPFSGVSNQFMLCLTEAARDQVLNKLEAMKTTYLRRIEQSKEVDPRPWQSQGSEEFVNQFQVKHTRKLISLEWIGDISKRCYTEPNFENCEPDSMKNGYTCLVPSDKEKFDLVYKKTQETGIQAVAQKEEAGVQTDPEIPTNACTQYAPETEISLKETSVTQEAIKTQDLNAFFDKYLNYLLQCLDYNEVYDLYHDDYPALYKGGEETQVQQLGTYHQYQSFTDVAAIEGKLVVSTSWHPNYTGIVAIAYANEIPCLMKELEFDSDQTDYEEEKTDEEGEGGEEPELGKGAKDWLVDERKERESTEQNTEVYERAVRRLKDIETAKLVWDLKIQEDTEEHRRATSETVESETNLDKYQYREYKEPELELEDIGEEGEEGVTPEVPEGQEPEAEEEAFGTLGKEESGSQKTNTKSSKRSLRDTLEADIAEAADEVESPATQVIEEGDEYMEKEEGSDVKEMSRSTTRSKQDTASFHMTSREARTISVAQRTSSRDSSRKKSHHRKKYKKSLISETKQSVIDQESIKSHRTPSLSESSLGLSETTRRDVKMPYYHDHEFFDEITDEEEIKEKQDELPLLELNNPVLIWSFVDDLTPKLRLDSPYEVRVVAFSQHNGNLIAGGTASGQVVLWDITGRIEELERTEALTHNQQKFRKRMEDLMNWRRDIRSKRRVRISAISNQGESHLEKITHLMWVGPTITVTDTLDIVQNPTPDPNLQIITSSMYGDIKVWDLKSDPIKVDTKKLVQQFKTKERFGRPVSLDVGISPHSRLHRRWKPKVALMTKYKTLPVMLTGFHFHNIPIKYVRVHGRMFTGVKEVLEDRVEYRAVPANVDSIPLQMYMANLFGEAGTIVWEPPEIKPPDGGNIPHTCRFWDSYHDGPVYRVTKHPFIPSVCLTVGGHVFALWHVANEEEPILVKRYFGVHVTDGSWSPLRPSLIRIARSDGVVEIWDLVIQNHAPATTVIVSGRVITNVSSPLLTEVRGLLGVADYNSAFRLFFIPQQFRVWTEKELARLTKFINREPERKKKMKQWSKWWRENNVNSDREEKKQAEEKKKQDEEVRLEKEKQEEARKKYNEEVYKWYMRRRGKPFLWQEEADDKWREKQEQHMHEVVMEKKKIDRSEMETLMRPIVKEEKNEAYKHEKAQERLKQADIIFRQTVDLIFPKSSKKVLTTSEETVSLNDEGSKLVDYYFGDNFEKLADEQEELIKRSPWQFDFEWSELLEKYNALRMLFNDRRRKRSKTLRWLRKKLREELLREGRKVHIRISHMNRYPKRKIKRRQENFEWLKETYGDDYNIYWDKHHPCRRFSDRKFRYETADDADSHYLGEFTEPEVEDEDVPQIFFDEKAKSSLELITQLGIEFIPEEIFKADLDANLITLEGRSSLGVKSIPSFVDQSSRKLSAVSEELQVPDLRLVPPGCQSPQDDSDLSTAIDDVEDSTSAVDNQLQELDYIQQSVGTKINTLQTKIVASQQKREISEGVKVKTDEMSTDEELDIVEGDNETLDGSSTSKPGSKSGSASRSGSKVSEKEAKTEDDEEDGDQNQGLKEHEDIDDQNIKDSEELSTDPNI